MTRKFSDMSLTPDEAAAHVFEHWEHGDDAGIVRLARVQTRARRLLPLWRQWGLQRLMHDVAREVVAELDDLSELASQRASSSTFDASSYHSGRSHGLDQASEIVAERFGIK